MIQSLEGLSPLICFVYSAGKIRTAGQTGTNPEEHPRPSSSSSARGERQTTDSSGRSTSSPRRVEETEEEREEKECSSAVCQVRQHSESRMRFSEMEGGFSERKENCLEGEGTPGRSRSEKNGVVQLSCWGEVSIRHAFVPTHPKNFIFAQFETWLCDINMGIYLSAFRENNIDHTMYIPLLDDESFSSYTFHSSR